MTSGLLGNTVKMTSTNVRIKLSAVWIFLKAFAIIRTLQRSLAERRGTSAFVVMDSKVHLFFVPLYQPRVKKMNLIVIDFEVFSD